jgi:hypothetical protein
MIWLNDAGESRAPTPTDDIFIVEFEPCPPDVGPLPAPIAEAATAALGVAGTAGSLAYFVKHFIASGTKTQQRHMFLLFWWTLVGQFRPARARIHKVARFLNKGCPAVEMLGVTAPSAHHAALKYASWQTNSLWQAAAVMADQTNSELREFDPTVVCRDPTAAYFGGGGEHPNQVIQNTILGKFEFILDRYKKCKISTDISRFETLILTEARNAADAYEDNPPDDDNYRAAIAKAWSKDGPQAWLDGQPKNLTFPQWNLLLAMSNARPNGLSKDELEDVNSNARRMLYDLKTNAPWDAVIVFPEAKGQGGYRLL